MRRGFTLLEMMVVVAVLGVVAALGVVSATELVRAAKNRSAVDSIADQVRELRDRAQSSGMAVILQISGQTIGFSVRTEPCDVTAPFPSPQATLSVPSSHLPLGMLYDEGGAVGVVCINPDGRMFGDAPSAPPSPALARPLSVGGQSFFPSTVLLATRASQVAAGCSDCVVLRRHGMIDAVVNGSASRCSSDADCAGGRCESSEPHGRCMPKEGAERTGDSGRMFGEAR